MLRCLGSWLCAGILVLVSVAVDAHAGGKPNIVLITVDSLRADRVGFLGASRGVTPALDELSHQSIIFERAYAQASETVASTATILTGSYPQVHRAGIFGTPLAPAQVYLPDLLHAAGYKTAAFVGSIRLDPREGPFQGYDRGFDQYDAIFHLPQRGEKRYQSIALPGDQVVAQATRWLSAHQESPYFLFVNLHDPEASSPVSYDRAVTSADGSIGKLLAFLRAHKWYDDTLIVIASDHGESLGPHGEDRSGVFLYDESIHVPLLVKLPGGRMSGTRIKNRVRLLDVAPTVLEVAGVSVSSQMQGQSLMRIAQGGPQMDSPAYARSDFAQQAFGCSVLESWRAGKYLYIRAPRAEFYDLTSDATATKNLADNSKATLETMASQLQALDTRLATGHSVADAGLTSSEMQKLASLGYVGLQKTSGGVKAQTTGLDPKDVIAVINQTRAAVEDLEDGKPETAIVGLRHVVALRPEMYLAQYSMGVALALLHKDAEAIPHLHKAIELQPDSPWAHMAMGLSLRNTGDFKTAAVHLEIASGHLPASSILHLQLAEVYGHLGRNEDAVRERGKATPQRKEAAK